MTVIVTRQNPDGSYDEVGMLNRRIYRQYNSIKTALRYAAKNWTGPVRFEFCDNTFSDPFCTKIRGEI